MYVPPYMYLDVHTYMYIPTGIYLMHIHVPTCIYLHVYTYNHVYTCMYILTTYMYVPDKRQIIS